MITLFTILTVLSATALLMGKNLTHSTIALVCMMLGVAGMYAYLDAPFMALLQILIFVMPILVHIVCIMLFSQNGKENTSNTKNLRWIKAIGPLFIAIILGIIISLLKTDIKGAELHNRIPEDLAPMFNLIFTKYKNVFILFSLLFLGGLFAGLTLIKKGDEHE